MAAQARPVPSATPSTAPQRPSSSDSPTTICMRSRGDMPNTPSKASCGARCATLSANTEYTRKAPVNKATNAITERLTR